MFLVPSTRYLHVWMTWNVLDDANYSLPFARLGQTSVIYSTLNYILLLRHQASFTDCQWFIMKGWQRWKRGAKTTPVFMFVIFSVTIFLKYSLIPTMTCWFFQGEKNVPLMKRKWQCEWFLLWRRIHADVITHFKFIGTAHVREKAQDDAHYGNNERRWR